MCMRTKQRYRTNGLPRELLTFLQFTTFSQNFQGINNDDDNVNILWCFFFLFLFFSFLSFILKKV